MGNRPSQNDEKSELDRYERIVEQAHKEIEFVRGVYKWIFGGVVVLFTLGITIAVIFIGNNVNELKSRLNQEIDIVERQVKSLIEEEFKQDNIHILVKDEAKNRIDTIADNLITEQIEEKFGRLEKSIQPLEGKLVDSLKVEELGSLAAKYSELGLDAILDENTVKEIPILRTAAGQTKIGFNVLSCSSWSDNT
jgi:hypothetical protein